jgi:dUTP pyrophosphatase
MSCLRYIKVKKVKTPVRGTSEAAGLDFFIPEDFYPVVLAPGDSVNIPSGIKCIIPKGYVGIFFNKSGVARKGLQIGACVIDSDYRGEVHIDLHNHSNQPVSLHYGMKIAQLLVQPIELGSADEISSDKFEELSKESKRGSGGFGSTGSF